MFHEEQSLLDMSDTPKLNNSDSDRKLLLLSSVRRQLRNITCAAHLLQEILMVGILGKSRGL